MEFYHRLKELCKAKKISMSALAKEIGLSNSAATYWKRGSMPKYETLKKIADYFGVTVEWLSDLSSDEISDVDYMSKITARNSGVGYEEAKEWYLKNTVEFHTNRAYIDAERRADDAIIDSFKGISEQQLKEYLLEDYESLNRLGRLEAIKRIGELASVKRYCKNLDE